MTEEKKQEKKMLFDRLKPGAEAEELRVSPGAMEMANAMDLMAKMCVEEGCTHCFGMTAGGSWGIEAPLMRNGIKRVHIRHEATAAFAADAWGKVTGRPGLIAIGSGTGITNLTTGIVPAYNGRVPVVALVGSHASSHDELFSAQGTVNVEKIFDGICKWAKQTNLSTDVLWLTKRAFRESVTPPQGPCVIGFEWPTLQYHADAPTAALEMYYTPGYWKPKPLRQLAPPEDIEATLRWIMEAEKPTIVVGPQVHYQHAAEELREFVKLTGIPTHCRRAGRGAISEYDPLNCGGRARGRVLRASDRCLVMGLNITWLEGQGRPPFWGADTKYIQLQACRQDVNLVLPTELEIIGDMKSLLRQMIDCAKDMGVTKPPEKWNNWRQFVVDAKEDYWQKTSERTKAMEGVVPLHPDILGKKLGEFIEEELNNDCFFILDGFTASSFSTDWFRAVRSGQVLDAGETVGLGHGVGMAIGAALATDCKVPILSMIGDGGIGCGGMDIETASRWNIPAIFVIWNNGVLVSGGWDLFLKGVMGKATGNDMLDSWVTVQGIRYDKLFAEVGCHAENVVKDAEIKPALKRAIDFVRKESKPAVINANTDPEVMQEVWPTSLIPLAMTVTEWHEVPEEGKKLILEEGFIRRPAVARAMGVRPSVIEAVEKYHAEKGKK